MMEGFYTLEGGGGGKGQNNVYIVFEIPENNTRTFIIAVGITALWNYVIIRFLVIIIKILNTIIIPARIR